MLHYANISKRKLQSHESTQTTCHLGHRNRGKYFVIVTNAELIRQPGYIFVAQCAQYGCIILLRPENIEQSVQVKV